MKKAPKILLLLLFCTVALCAVACKADPKPNEPTSFTLSFYTDGSLTSTLTTKGHEEIELPSPETKAHFRFDGWFFDQGTWQDQLTNTYYLDKAPDGDKNLYAKWTQTEFNVTYEENGGSALSDGWFGTIQNKPVTEKTGFLFQGWYTSSDLSGDPVTFPYVLTENTTLYAGWQKILDASLVSIDGFSIQGTQVKKDTAVLPNAESIDFNELNVKVSEGAEWALYEDESCTRPIENNIVTLETGANTFYLKVSTQTKSAIYTVTVEKKDGFTLEVYENGVLKQTLVANKGDVFEKPVPVFDETLYEFDGDYYTDHDMTTPFTDYTANANKQIYLKIYYIGVKFSKVINTVQGAIPTNDAEVYLKIPSEIGGVPVLTIDSSFQNDFAFKKNLLEIYISDGVEEIKNSTFYYCDKLRKVRLPDGILLRGGIFSYCPLLTEVECDGIIRSSSTNFSSTGISKDESNYENGAFYIGTYLAGVDTSKMTAGTFRVKEGTRSISGQAFSNVESKVKINSVDLGNTVEYIGSYAFDRMTSLLSFTGTDALTSMGTDALRDSGYYNTSSNRENDLLYLGHCLVAAKSDLSGEVTIKNGTVSIADSVFKDMRKITSVTFPDTLEIIGNEAFCIGRLYSGEPVLQAIHLPASVKKVGEYAFENQIAVREITLEEGLETIGYCAFSGCDNAGDIIVPSTVKYIGALGLCCGSNSAIYLAGDISSIKLIKDWNGLGVSLTPYYEYSAEKPAAGGNYWHYVDGKPVVWEI